MREAETHRSWCCCGYRMHFSIARCNCRCFSHAITTVDYSLIDKWQITTHPLHMILLLVSLFLLWVSHYTLSFALQFSERFGLDTSRSLIFPFSRQIQRKRVGRKVMWQKVNWLHRSVNRRLLDSCCGVKHRSTFCRYFWYFRYWTHFMLNCWENPQSCRWFFAQYFERLQQCQK